MEQRRLAVEANVSQAKRLGFTANAYIVEGESFLFIFGTDEQLEQFEVVTNKTKNWHARLNKTNVPVGNTTPRPSVLAGWEQQNGVWEHT